MVFISKASQLIITRITTHAHVGKPSTQKLDNTNNKVSLLSEPPVNRIHKPWRRELGLLCTNIQDKVYGALKQSFNVCLGLSCYLLNGASSWSDNNGLGVYMSHGQHTCK